MQQVYDFVIIGSGFGGSVSALRLSEKGYRVMVLEKGRRYEDRDFARSNWQFWKYLWAPWLGAQGILQISLLKGVMVLHGAGVGGGSLGYANVLEVPSPETFATPAWNEPLPWGQLLEAHYATARRMLGAAANPQLWPADQVLRRMAEELGQGHTFRGTEVGAFFGEAGAQVPDPYFDGAGPQRSGCQHCGGCMVGCRHNAKNSLPKNYLHLALRNGVELLDRVEVRDVRPLAPGAGPARYRVTYRASTPPFQNTRSILAGNVIFAAGVLGSLRLLLELRDVRGSLPALSPHLGERVRTNSEALLGSVARSSSVNYSEGVAISSIFNADEITRIEPVRYPEHSGLMRMMAAPLVDLRGSLAVRLLRSLGWVLRHPLDFLRAQVLPGWARRVTILLVMQHADNRMRLRIGRSLFTLGRRGLVAEAVPGYEINAQVQGSHALTRAFAARTDGIPMGSWGENLLNLPTTAHILGGAMLGATAAEGVVDDRFQVHGYPGLFIIDGSVVPANPGVNPSLTIAALAEYAMSRMPAKDRP